MTSTKRGATDCRVNDSGGFDESRSAIVQLDPCDFERCSAIWDIKSQSDLAEQFKQDLVDGNRITFVYLVDGNPVGEISIVFDANDADYTVLDRRLYVSHLIVNPDYRRQGIGRKLLRHVVKTASEMGYYELSVGVDLDNFAALRLYFEEGFNRILFVGKDADGPYMKLMLTLKR